MPKKKGPPTFIVPSDNDLWKRLDTVASKDGLDVWDLYLLFLPIAGERIEIATFTYKLRYFFDCYSKLFPEKRDALRGKFRQYLQALIDDKTVLAKALRVADELPDV